MRTSSPPPITCESVKPVSVRLAHLYTCFCRSLLALSRSVPKRKFSYSWISFYEAWAPRPLSNMCTGTSRIHQIPVSTGVLPLNLPTPPHVCLANSTPVYPPPSLLYSPLPQLLPLNWCPENFSAPQLLGYISH